MSIEIVEDWSAYSPYFGRDEFACSHTGSCRMQSHFMRKLLDIRMDYGKPMVISSGFRDPSHPIEAKKERSGEHTFGTAVDVAVQGVDAMRLLQVALAHGISRVGVKQDNKGTEYLHLGVGGPGLPNPALWSY